MKKVPERHYKVAEVAERYFVTPRTVRNWIQNDSLRAWRRGRLIRIPQSALDEFDAKS
ncbi:MAG: helix-turn-helix domain-containing protein [Hyphomicrobium sp.]